MRRDDGDGGSDIVGGLILKAVIAMDPNPLHLLADSLGETGRPLAALALLLDDRFQEAEARLGDLSDDVGPTAALPGLVGLVRGAVAVMCRYPDAGTRLERACDLTATGHAWQAAYLTACRSRLHVGVSAEEAAALARQALAGYQALGSRRGELATRDHLALTAVTLADLADAEQHLLAAETVRRDLGLPMQPATALTQAYVCGWKGDADGALAAIERVLAVWDGLSEGASLVPLILTRAEILATIGRRREAEDVARPYLDHPWDKARAKALEVLIILARHQDKASEADALTDRFADLGLGPFHDLTVSWHRAANAYARHDTDAALRHLETFLTSSRDSGSRTSLIRGLCLQLDCLESRGEPSGAAAVRRQLSDLCALSGTSPAAVLALHRREFGGSETPPTLQVTCFGTFQVATGRGQSIDFGAQAGLQRLALAMLIARPEGVSAEALTDALYPEKDVGTKALAMVLSRLRQALRHHGFADVVHWHDHRYRLSPDVSVHCDLHRFNHHWQAADRDGGDRPHHDRQINQLYRQEPFVDTAEQPWLIALRHQCHERWRQALARLVAAAEAEGRHEEALALLSDATSRFPLALDVQRDLLDRLRRSGRHELAETWMQDLTTLWRRQHGMELPAAFMAWWWQGES